MGKELFLTNLNALLAGRTLADVAKQVFPGDEYEVGYQWLRRVATKGMGKPSAKLKKLCQVLGVSSASLFKPRDVVENETIKELQNELESLKRQYSVIERANISRMKQITILKGIIGEWGIMQKYKELGLPLRPDLFKEEHTQIWEEYVRTLERGYEFRLPSV